MNKQRVRRQQFPHMAIYDEQTILLSSYTANLLNRNRVRSVEQLLNMSDQQLFDIPGFGDKCYDEVQEALNELFQPDDGRCKNCGQPWPLI